MKNATNNDFHVNIYILMKKYSKRSIIFFIIRRSLFANRMCSTPSATTVGQYRESSFSGRMVFRLWWNILQF